MRAASPKAADDDLGGQAILEEALIAIEGIAAVLLVIGFGAEANSSHLARAADYLADRLQEHHDAARDGYLRIFRFDQYNSRDRVRS
jgi:hypothetical protein